MSFMLKKLLTFLFLLTFVSQGYCGKVVTSDRADLGSSLERISIDGRSVLGRIEDTVLFAVKPNAEDGVEESSDVFVLADLYDQECELVKTSQKIVSVLDATAVNVGAYLLFFSGESEHQKSGSVAALKWCRDNNIVEKKDVVSLPSQFDYITGCYLNGYLYIYGGRIYEQSDSKNSDLSNLFYRIRINAEASVEGGWENLVSLPQEGIVDPKLVTQHNGFKDNIYLVGGYETAQEKPNQRCYLFDTDLMEWKSIDLLPSEEQIAVVKTLGQSDITAITDSGRLFCYNAITDTWRSVENVSGQLCGNPETFVLYNSNEISAILTHKNKSFGVLNYSILGVYLFLLLAVGFYCSRHENGVDDFFLAGRRIPWWAAGLSLFGTQLSAITFMAIPSKTYSSDWRYFIGNMSVIFIAAPVTCMFFIPFFRRLNVSTAYEYLEKRFGVSVRQFASLIYIIMQLIKMGVVVYLPALALTTVMNIDIRLSIIIMGIFCTIYTVLGGIEAVIWTDVLQVVVLLGGALISLGIILADLGDSFVPYVSEMYENAKFSLGTAEIDFTRPTLIVVFISMFSVFAPYASDQTLVQRYLTTKDERAAKKSVWTNAVISVPAGLLFFSIGSLLFMFYKKNPASLSIGMANDSIFPWFILNEMPAGVSGIIISGLFAAAMSTLDSSMNSVSSAIVNDFIHRYNRGLAKNTLLKLARIITVILGGFGTVAALLISIYDIKSIWDCFSLFIGPFVGSLCGFFILGVFTKRANTFGAFLGVFAAVVTTYFLQFRTELHFFMYGTIGLLVSFITGYVASIITGGNKKNLAGLTMYTLNQHCSPNDSTEKTVN